VYRHFVHFTVQSQRTGTVIVKLLFSYYDTAVLDRQTECHSFCVQF